MRLRTPPKVRTGAMSMFEGNAEAYRLASKFNSAHLHWSEMQRRDTGGIDPNDLWSLMTALRKNQMKEIKIGGIVLRHSVIDEFHKIAHDLDMVAAAGFIPDDGSAAGYAKHLSISTLMEEAIASGMIEGASTTRKAAKSMLREGRRPRDRSERMILNNYRGMEHIMAAKKEELSIGCILELHRIMTDGTLDNDAWEGRFRSSDEDDIVVADRFTGKVRHIPPPSSDVNMLMEELCRYANDDSIFTHPLIKGAIIHFIVAYIHPFADGNGRTARAMMYWHLLRNGYGIFEYLAVSKTIKEHRGRYDDAYVMCETDDLDITYFIRYNLRMMEESLGNLREYLGRKTKERMEFEAGGYGLNMRQEAILRDASKSGEPFGIRAVETEYGVAYQTARLDILKLEGLGLIRKHGRDANKVLYIFAGGKGKRPIP